MDMPEQRWGRASTLIENYFEMHSTGWRKLVLLDKCDRVRMASLPLRRSCERSRLRKVIAQTANL
eukprot:1433031-Heterocapsa_arctica.AAC.1